jgi:hypothetical protein
VALQSSKRNSSLRSEMTAVLYVAQSVRPQMQNLKTSGAKLRLQNTANRERRC